MLLPRATYNRCCSRTATTVSKNPVTKEKGITLKHFLIFPSLPMNPPRPGHCSSCLYLSFFLCPSICHVTRLSLFFTALLNHSCVIFSAFFSICSFLFLIYVSHCLPLFLICFHLLCICSQCTHRLSNTNLSICSLLIKMFFAL